MYPKWVTREHGIGPVLCLNEAEEKALLDDWAARSTPADPVDEVAALRAKADELGIKYDRRWGAAKLREALEA